MIDDQFPMEGGSSIRDKLYSGFNEYRFQKMTDFFRKKDLLKTSFGSN